MYIKVHILCIVCIVHYVRMMYTYPPPSRSVHLRHSKTSLVRYLILHYKYGVSLPTLIIGTRRVPTCLYLHIPVLYRSTVLSVVGRPPPKSATFELRFTSI